MNVAFCQFSEWVKLSAFQQVVLTERKFALYLLFIFAVAAVQKEKWLDEQKTRK